MDIQFNKLSPEHVQGLLTEKPAPLLIDTLPEDHFQKVRLPHAYNACVYQVDFLQQAEKITSDREAPIILYGGSENGMEALAAAEKLHHAGYRNIALLAGGLEAWRKAGLPLEGTAPDEPEAPFSTVPLADGDYKVDSKKSCIEWTGRNRDNKHFGTVEIAEGRISIGDGQASGSFIVDMNTVRNINLEGEELQPVLLRHLSSDDFFFTKAFPTATYTLEKIYRAEDGALGSPNYIIEGFLELRGVINILNFPATVTAGPEGGLVAEAHFDIDRTRYKINYGSGKLFEHLGMHLVFDLISLQILIVAERASHACG